MSDHPGWPLPLEHHWQDLSPMQIDACLRTRGLWYPGKSVAPVLRREVRRARQRTFNGAVFFALALVLLAACAGSDLRITCEPGRTYTEAFDVDVSGARYFELWSYMSADYVDWYTGQHPGPYPYPQPQVVSVHNPIARPNELGQVEVMCISRPGFFDLSWAVHELHVEY